MSLSTPFLTPQAFWDEYRDGFRGCLWKNYRNLPARTANAMQIAESLMRRVGLDVTGQWCRVDLIGWHYPDKQDQPYNWLLDVTFDHENAENWRYELGSHVHFAADLCVIAAYWDYRNGGLPDLTAEVRRSVTRLARQVRRVPNRSWLFIFGPDINHPQQPFVAFTFDPGDPCDPGEPNDPGLTVRQLPDPDPLRPADWPDYP